MPNTEPLIQDTTAPAVVETTANEDTEPRRTRATSRAAGAAPKPVTAAAKRPADTKAEIVLKKLRSAKGASIEQLIQATGWQAHSVRGFLSGTVKKKMGLVVTSDTGKDAVRRYRVEDAPKAG